MKSLLALVCSLMIAAPGFAQSAASGQAEADTVQTPKDAPAKTTPRKAPVRITLPTKAEEKAAAPKKADATKKAEPAKKEEPKIKGVVVSRGEKGFMGVEIVGSSFKITFYDTKKKPIAPDVARAALRWDAKYKVGQERVILNPDPDGKSLSNPRTIRPPYHFKLYITLVQEATEKEDPAGETHVIDFRDGGKA
jgi:hypothetical protein